MTEKLELTEDTTAEEMTAVLDQIEEEVAAEAEEVSDGERHHPEGGPVEHPPVNEEDTGEEQEAEEESEDDSDWLTDELRSEAAAVGIDEKDLEEFTSREELDRSLKILNRQIDAEREKGEEGEKKETEKKSESESETDGKYEVTLDKDVYDDELVDELTRMRDHYEARLSALEERFQAEADKAAEERFDRGVDALEFSTLFGKTGEESDTQLARRTELFDRVKIEQEVLERLGRNVTDYDALVQRVARAAFPDDFEKRTLKNHTRRVSRQSEKRQGGGETRPTDPTEDPRDEAERLYKEMMGD